MAMAPPTPTAASPKATPIRVINRAFADVALKDRLDKAIERLPIQYQVLVNGHYLKGLQYDELAEALNLPTRTNSSF